MGAAFSGGSLCRFVGGVEILVSSVIIGFGSQTLYRFYRMNDDFKNEFPRIQYSGITAIGQGTLTILAAIMLLLGTKEKPPAPDNEKEDDEIFATNKSRASLVLKLWLVFSVFSIGLLVFVFAYPVQYCIQTEGDKDARINKTGGGDDGIIYVDGKKTLVAPCYAEDPQILGMRQSIGDLYSYCLVNIFALVVFIFVCYSQLKRVNRRSQSLSFRETDEDQLHCLPPPSNTDHQEQDNEKSDSKPAIQTDAQ